jgi:hypothetical protein
MPEFVASTASALFVQTAIGASALNTDLRPTSDDRRTD